MVDAAPVRGAVHMATDSALLASVRDGAPPVLRLYRWSPACLSFGRNQPAQGLYDPARARAAGIDVVRRATGGLAVLHDAEVTYAVVVPAGELGGPRATYAAINAALAGALRRLGVPAQLAPAARIPAPLSAQAPPCFAEPAPGEVVAAGRKLVGSAQRTEGRTVLQHGSILLEGDQSRILALRTTSAGAAAEQAGARHATLADVLGHVPAWEELVAAVTDAFEADAGISLAPAALSRDERTCVDALTEQFDDDAWTWRR
jgi:lipoyl(octanoyl) transferase